MTMRLAGQEVLEDIWKTEVQVRIKFNQNIES